MAVEGGWVLFLAFGVLFTFFLLVIIYWYSFWVTDKTQGLSPYTGLPLRHVSELSYFYKERIILYMLSFHQYDNRPFKLRKAAFCRETGRIFPNCVTMFDTIKVDWTFLQKRYPGDYVSWGSLNGDQRKAISDAHEGRLYGFQTEMSSPNPAPRAIEPEYVITTPGPLYVDLQTKVLLGWKVVPETDLEVLVVQKPKKPFQIVL